MTFLTNSDALAELASHLDDDEVSRSSYWQAESNTFEVTKNGNLSGTTVLGTMADNSSRIPVIAHFFWRLPFLVMGLPFGTKFWRYLKMGKKIAHSQGRIFTQDMLRQVFSVSLVHSRLANEKMGGANLVIGDGYGVVSSLFMTISPGVKTISVNLNKSLLLDAAYIAKSFPKKNIALTRNVTELVEAYDDPSISAIIVQADNAKILASVPIAIAVNIVSMQEMDPPIIDEYFRILRQNPANKTAFYCCNKLMKKLYDGTVIRFSEYPWRAEDEILHDQLCPWSQWFYSRNLPFWHYRFGKNRKIWHRLALLHKTAPS